MIRVLSPNMQEVARITAVEKGTCSRSERINLDNTLSFSIAMRRPGASAITPNSIIEHDGDLFEIASYNKSQGSDGQRVLSIDCEHVSYHLNDPEYNLEYYTQVGSAPFILGEILAGTGFSLGTVEIGGDFAFSMQEASSRRSLLMQFITYIGGEVIFSGRTVSVVAHRGNPRPVTLRSGRDILIVDETVSMRERDEYGNPRVSYMCEAINAQTLALGDAVRLQYDGMGIDVSLRVVSLTRDPFNPRRTTLEIGNFAYSLESDLYRMEHEAVRKDAHLYGVRFSPAYGMRIRRDAPEPTSETTFNSDTWEVVIDGKKILYADWLRKTLVFNGILAADVIEALSGMVTPMLWADHGLVLNAYVTRLRTDLSKPFRFLLNDTNDVHFQDIGDTEIASGRYFKVARCLPDLEPVQFTLPSITILGTGETPLWWYKGIEGGSMTLDPEYGRPEPTEDDPETDEQGNILLDDDGEPIPFEPKPVPVMVYQYDEIIAERKELRLYDWGWGVRNQWASGINASGRGAGLIDKDPKYMFFGMEKGDGDEIGGMRVSVADSTELYSKRLQRWIDPAEGAGGGGEGLTDWDQVDLRQDGTGFKVYVGSSEFDFTTPRDANGKLIGVNGHGKDRVVRRV